jgi:hypothetical protein
MLSNDSGKIILAFETLSTFFFFYFLKINYSSKNNVATLPESSKKDPSFMPAYMSKSHL